MYENMSRREQLAYMVGLIEFSDKGSHVLAHAIRFAQDCGIYADMNVGESGDFFEDKERTAEWLMGQFIDGYSKDDHLVYNSGINLSRSFLNKDYGYNK